ncbi:hypothetical protein K2X05_02550 [bacterium]|nr:hypothetical protein [bacterium]
MIIFNLILVPMFLMSVLSNFNAAYGSSCPNIAGKYQCQGKFGNKDVMRIMSVVKTKKGSKEKFQFDFVTASHKESIEGFFTEVPFKQKEYDTTYSAYCKSNRLIYSEHTKSQFDEFLIQYQVSLRSDGIVKYVLLLDRVNTGTVGFANYSCKKK